MALPHASYSDFQAWGHGACMLSCFSHVRLCSPMDCNPPGSSVHGILQAGTMDWFAMPFSRDLPHLGIEPASLISPALAGGFSTTRLPLWLRQ